MYPQQQEPDPHGYMTEGKRRVWTYIYRQLWSMRWVSIILVGLMTTYSIMVGEWIPYLQAHPMNLMIFFMFWWVVTNSMTKLTITACQREKTQGQGLEQLYRAIGYGMWMVYGMSLVGTYWVTIIVYIWILGPTQ